MFHVVCYMFHEIMSGHSKWATTHRKKEILDSKKGAIFTKLSKNITIAAKHGGGDPESNFKLRLAVDKAKQVNMPKDNIEKAIKKGTGELEGTVIEEITYEGFGPAGSAFVVEVATDNRNRSASDIKHIFSKNSGNLGASGSVSWQFERKGVILADNSEFSKKKDELELELIDAGTEDIKENGEFVEIITKIEDLQKVKEVIDRAKIKIESANLEWLAKEEVKVDSEEDREQIEKFMEALDDNEDVQDFYTNVVI